MAATTPEGQGRDAFAILLDFGARIGKALAVLVGTLYVIGYVVIANRLAQYGVSATQLLDAQYLVAGLVLGVLLWLTVVVGISARNYAPKRDYRSVGWISANLIFSIPLLIFLVNVSIGQEELFLSIGESISPLGVPLVLLYGELGLWILIVGFKNKVFPFFSAPDQSWWRRNGFLNIIRATYILYLFLFTSVLFIQTPLYGIEVYNDVPQAYGGGKPLQVQLYVDGEKVPAELLVANSSRDLGSLSRTIPLNLIFRTSTEYIVDPIDDCQQRAWVINANTVYAMVEEDFDVEIRCEQS